MLVAAVDLGTDSARLLIAEVEGSAARTVAEHAVVTRLGRGVDATGRLDAEAMRATEAACAEHRERIEAAGCERVGVALTSAVRDAEDGADFAARLARQHPDWTMRVLDGDQESWLVFRGATLGEEIEGPTLVVDIGGGSTEVAVGTAGRLMCSGSADVGTLRLGERHVDRDGYTSGTRAAVGREIAGEIEREVPEAVRRSTVAGLVTATTPTWKMALGFFEATGGFIERSSCEMLDALLWRADATALRPPGWRDLPEDRIETITIGLTILVEAMRLFDLPGLRLVGRDLLQGLAVTLAEDAFQGGELAAAAAS